MLTPFSIWIPADTWSGLDVFKLLELVEQRHIRETTVQRVLTSRMRDAVTPFTKNIDTFLEQFEKNRGVLAGATAVDIMLSHNDVSRLSLHLLFPRDEGAKFREYVVLVHGYMELDAFYDDHDNSNVRFIQRLWNPTTGRNLLVLESRTNNAISPLSKFTTSCDSTFISTHWYCVVYATLFESRTAVMFTGEDLQPPSRIERIQAHYIARGFEWINAYPSFWRIVGDGESLVGGLSADYDVDRILDALNPGVAWRVLNRGSALVVDAYQITN